MKKSIFSLAIAATFMAGAIFTSCQSPAEKVEGAEAKVQDAKQDLKEVQKDANAEAQKAANAEEWRIFKSESEVKIRANETYIAELKEKMKRSGRALDAVYAKNIEALEQKNKDMRSRIDVYDKSQSNWESFKTEFGRDMDELGQALKNLAVDNKK